jgi:2-iminobutanoate/2-iminopropanoate deaminase
MIERIHPAGATPRGPYSPAVRAGETIYVSGQVPSQPGDAREQTRQVLTSVKNILEASGATLADVVRCGVFLTDAADFKPMNEVYAEFFGEARPARTTVIVAALPVPEAKVEIDAVAYKE